MKYLMLLISIISLTGCNLDGSNSSSTCADCIWNESSQTLVRGVRGGFAGISDPVSVYFPESGEYVSPSGVSRYPTDTGYTEAGMSDEALEYLKTVKVIQETLMSNTCSFDSFYSVIKITDNIGEETSYFSNQLNCNNYIEGRSYISHNDMETLLDLFPNTEVITFKSPDLSVVTPITNIWQSSSQRVEIDTWNNSVGLFEAVVDLTVDTMSEKFSSSIRQVESLDLIITCTDDSEFVEQVPHYQVTITDEIGIRKVYSNTIPNCGEEVDFINTKDVDVLIKSSGVEF